MGHIIRHASVVLLLVQLAACQDVTAPEAELLPADTDSLPALPAPAPAVAAGDLVLSASSVLLGDDADPRWVGLSVWARNTTSAPVSTERLCMVQIWAVHDSSASSVAVWRAPLEPVSSCPSPATGLSEIPPGRIMNVRAAGNVEFARVRDILGDSLPQGRYRFGAVVRVGNDTVAVPAGTVVLSRDVRPPLRDPRVLHYAVATRVESVAPRELVTRVVATNPTDRHVYLQYGACTLRLRAYRTPERTGWPVWRLRSEHDVCSAYLATKLLAPGDIIPDPARRREMVG